MPSANLYALHVITYALHSWLAIQHLRHFQKVANTLSLSTYNCAHWCTHRSFRDSTHNASWLASSTSKNRNFVSTSESFAQGFDAWRSAYRMVPYLTSKRRRALRIPLCEVPVSRQLLALGRPVGHLRRHLKNVGAPRGVPMNNAVT